MIKNIIMIEFLHVGLYFIEIMFIAFLPMIIAGIWSSF